MSHSVGRNSRAFTEIVDLEHLASHESRQGEYTGTHALMLAVLEEGIRSYLNGKGRVRDEAEYWLFTAKGHQSLFSFPIVCEHLGLNPEATRTALRRLNQSNGKVRANRSRPNVSRSRHILR